MRDFFPQKLWVTVIGIHLNLTSAPFEKGSKSEADNLHELCGTNINHINQ